uniref:Uncharacterized protein n=1 Tax=Anguilla anguilla TaxID=7936 RepID=A0A0E9XR54_ANGAN
MTRPPGPFQQKHTAKVASKHC